MKKSNGESACRPEITQHCVQNIEKETSSSKFKENQTVGYIEEATKSIIDKLVPAVLKVVLEGVQENLSESVRTIVTEPIKGLAQRLSDLEELCLGLSKKLKSLDEKCMLNVNSQVPDKLANVMTSKPSGSTKLITPPRKDQVDRQHEYNNTLNIDAIERSISECKKHVYELEDWNLRHRIRVVVPNIIQHTRDPEQTITELITVFSSAQCAAMYNTQGLFRA